MQKVHVHDALGMILCHDITEIIPGEFKGRAFKKGHVIEEKDVSKLLRLGLLPKILTGSRITKAEIALMGHGGLCLKCPTCVYPACPFGRD